MLEEASDLVSVYVNGRYEGTHVPAGGIGVMAAVSFTFIFRSVHSDRFVIFNAIGNNVKWRTCRLPLFQYIRISQYEIQPQFYGTAAGSLIFPRKETGLGKLQDDHLVIFQNRNGITDFAVGFCIKREILH